MKVILEFFPKLTFLMLLVIRHLDYKYLVFGFFFIISTVLFCKYVIRCLSYLDELVEQLIKNPDIIVGANVSDDSESFVSKDITTIYLFNIFYYLSLSDCY